MNSALTIETLGILVVMLGAAGGVWWRWHLANQALRDESQKVREDLSEFRLHVAEHYATKSGVSEQMVTLTKAVTDVRDHLDKRLDTITDRLDRVIEHNHKPVRRSSS